MTLVEREYNRALDSMSGAERVRRTSSLYNSVRQMYTLQVLQEEPLLSPELIAIRVARRMYASDPKTQILLDKAERELG